MGIIAVMKIGSRMARRNHLYLFAWLCATVVPGGLQLIAGFTEELREYLGNYYGELSLYMFFAMTYGFGVVFVSYYLVGGFRQTGSLDLLRVSAVRPWEIVLGVQAVLQSILLPPLLVFLGGLVGYMAVNQRGSFISDQPWWVLLGLAAILWGTQVLLSLLPCLGLFRREAIFAFVASILVLPVNALPVAIYALHVPYWLFTLLLTGFIALLLATCIWLVARLWPPQTGSRREQ